MSNLKNSYTMKNFFAIAALVAVMSVLSAFSANAQVINPQPQAPTKEVAFWVGDEVHFRWTGKELITTTLVLDGPVMLHQEVLLEDGNIGTSRRNIFTELYNPATDWKNPEETLQRPVEISFRPYTVREKDYTVHGNIAISTDFPQVRLAGENSIEMGWEIFAYDIKIEKGRITLSFHKMLWVKEKKIYDKLVRKEVFAI